MLAGKRPKNPRVVTERTCEPKRLGRIGLVTDQPVVGEPASCIQKTGQPVEQRGRCADPWFALEVLGHRVRNDQAEDDDAVRQLRARLSGVLEIVALNEPEPDRLSEARTDRPASRTGILESRSAEKRSAPGVSSTKLNASFSASPLIASSVR